LLRTVTVANRTLDAIDAAISADSGILFRKHQHDLFREAVEKTADAFRTDEDEFRSHLGASIIGSECARYVWNNFRWVTPRSVADPRMQRLWNRGHLEEPRFIAMLLMLGVEVWQYDEQGKQFRISWGEGHCGGSGDGVGRGIPDLDPGTAAVCEFKTHSEKSFTELAGKLPEWRAYRKDPTRLHFPGQGVRIAKFEHFVQMQVYMRKMGLAAALYMAVCKNTDDVYAEIVTLDTEFADQFLDRGDKIYQLDKPPKKISESPGFWKCRFCDDRPTCHLGMTPAVNCRTCRHSKPVADGKWRCTLHDVELTKQAQLAACQSYSKNPAI
jgi:hypothetical protein